MNIRLSNGAWSQIFFSKPRQFYFVQNKCVEPETRTFQRRRVLKARSFQNLFFLMVLKTFQRRRVLKTRSFQNLFFYGSKNNCFEHEHRIFQRRRLLKTCLFQNLFWDGIKNNCFQRENMSFQRHRVSKTRSFQNLRFLWYAKQLFWARE